LACPAFATSQYSGLIIVATDRRTARPALAAGDEQVPRDARVETRIFARAGMGSGHGFVTACVRIR